LRTNPPSFLTDQELYLYGSGDQEVEVGDVFGEIAEKTQVSRVSVFPARGILALGGKETPGEKLRFGGSRLGGGGL